MQKAFNFTDKKKISINLQWPIFHQNIGKEYHTLNCKGFGVSLVYVTYASVLYENKLGNIY